MPTNTARLSGVYCTVDTRQALLALLYTSYQLYLVGKLGILYSDRNAHIFVRSPLQSTGKSVDHMLSC